MSVSVCRCQCQCQWLVQSTRAHDSNISFLRQVTERMWTSGHNPKRLSNAHKRGYWVGAVQSHAAIFLAVCSTSRETRVDPSDFSSFRSRCDEQWRELQWLAVAVDWSTMNHAHYSLVIAISQRRRRRTFVNEALQRQYDSAPEMKSFYNNSTPPLTHGYLLHTTTHMSSTT